MDKSLKILLVSTSYPEGDKDWRGRFIVGMLNSLSDIETLNLTIWAPPGNLPDRITYAATAHETVWLKNLMHDGGIAHILRKSGVKAVITVIALMYQLRQVYRRSSACDVFHVNWLQNALPMAGTRKPALITVLGSDYGLLRLPLMTSLLRRIIRQRRCIIAPNAGWMVPVLEEKFGDIAKVYAIPFGVDDAWFGLERNVSWDEPQKWIVVSRVTTKKIGPLFEWGKTIFNERCELHLFGPLQDSITIPPWIHYHGPTHPKELESVWFPRATGIISLSNHDEGRPQVILEAMAAGLPVVASRIPAHNDVIHDGVTGRLVLSEIEFVQALTKLANPTTNQRIGAAAKKWLKGNVGTWADCAKRYELAYQELIERHE